MICGRQSIKFEDFDIQAGQDAHGVPTALASTNATVKLVYRNTGTFFGVHVTSTPLQLSYEDLVLASGVVSLNYSAILCFILFLFVTFSSLRPFLKTKIVFGALIRLETPVYAYYEHFGWGYRDEMGIQ